jgi:hypothetical protein
MKLIFAFRNFANALKNTQLYKIVPEGRVSHYAHDFYISFLLSVLIRPDSNGTMKPKHVAVLYNKVRCALA